MIVVSLYEFILTAFMSALVEQSINRWILIMKAAVVFKARCHLRRIVRIGVYTPMMGIELAGLRSPRPLYRIIYIGRRIGWIADRVNHYSSWHVKSIIGSCNVRYRQICIIQEDRIFRKCRLDCSMVLWWFTVSRINAYCNIKTSSRALFNNRIV